MIFRGRSRIMLPGFRNSFSDFRMLLDQSFLFPVSSPWPEVPPHIEEEETSSDTEVREGSDVSLRCVAKGSPDPETTWRREDGQEITIGRKKVTSIKSTDLNITKVGRLQMGAYLCIASNGVQPSVSKRIVLNVNFVLFLGDCFISLAPDRKP
ncbi:protein CEPU-1 [Caerostris extrusa]|uniref:Protein CEPU-1 n=1 Tax=Caerostris extrusa TaxID=172846 RepID=A0AAV4SLF1_CAEEX|nr:protein CEPU-1 [Caerostris extrusa]